MDIILELFKYLTTSFTPVEFLVVIALLGTATFLLVNFALKRRKAIKALFGKGEDDDLKIISKQLDTVVTREDLERLKVLVNHEFESLRQDTIAFKEKFIEISAIRQAIVEKELHNVILAVGENRRYFSDQHDETLEQQALILSTSNRIVDEQAKVLSRVSGMDEYMKAAVPEFRTYHRDIDDDIKLLGRDLAVIERSLTLSLNSNSGVKLR